jgi:hypothetical protein
MPLFTEPARPPTLAAHLMVVCCHCGRIRRPEGWRVEAGPPTPPVSHGICRPCLAAHYPDCPMPAGFE